MLINNFKKGSQGSVRGTFKDPHPQVEQPTMVEFVVETNETSIEIGVDGYEDRTAAFGYARPIHIEYYEGKLMVRIWADANSEEPTHVIDMSGAKEEA